MAALRFSPQQQEAFARLSHDRSPLHCDPDHARRTPYGKVVLHGMAAVLGALGAWANGRPFALEKIRGRFVRPLFTGEDYALEVKERGEQVTLKLLMGRALRAEVKLSWKPHAPIPEGPLPAFDPLREAADFALEPTGEAPHSLGRLPYEAGPGSAAAAFGLSAGQLPRHQLNALCAASYLVGMVAPGRRALFSDFELELEPSADGPFELRDLAVTFDPRFRQLHLRGAGSGVRALALTAFRRPAPVTPTLEEVRAGVALTGQPFAGQTALVSGASRGFGAVLAQGLALGGARVLVHYLASEAEARALVEALLASGATAELVRADLARAEDVERLRGEVQAKAGALDLVVDNAAGPIEAEGFFDQGPEGFLDAVQRQLALSVRLAHALLPAVRPGGRWVAISSAWVARPEPKFAHYVAAKAAAEGLYRALAAEHEGPRFVLARPPRMLTDQTNLAWQREAPASAITVARKLLEALAASPEGERCRTIEL